METKMNKAAITKHEIYNKLVGFSEQDLSDIANFIDFMRHKKKLEAKKVVKLEGILKGQDIDLSELKALKQQTWRHVDQELDNG
jgi:predicted nucleotidyltransferase